MKLVKHLEPLGLKSSKQSKSLYEMRPVYRVITEKPKTRRQTFLSSLNSDEFMCILSYLAIADSRQVHKALSVSRRLKYLRVLIESHLVTTKVRQVDELLYINTFVRIYSIPPGTMLKFLNAKCKKEPIYEIIKADVDRTYVRGERYHVLKKYLLNVLSAVSANFPKIGYIQGLNYLVRTMYQNGLSENQSFAFLSFLLTDLQLQQLYANNMTKVFEYCYVLEVYLYNFIPELYFYLQQIEIQVMYFAASWFITLFSEQLPLHTVNRIWNLFLLKGWKVMIKFAIAVLMAYREDIMAKSKDTLSTYLRYFLETSFSPKKEEEIFKIFMSIKITNSMVDLFCRKMNQVERDSQISIRRMRKNSVEHMKSIDRSILQKQSSSISNQNQSWCYCQYKKPSPAPPRQFFSFCQNSDDVIY